MGRIRDYVLVRHRHNWLLFLRFGLVGGSGVLVNMIVLILLKRLGPDPDGAAVGIPLTAFNVRWYHIYSTVAFLVANLWNFQLNRSWTFRSDRHQAWWREYWPFLVVGLIGQAIGLVLLTLLMHPGSFLALPPAVLDDSTGLRTRLYWAQLIVIGVVTPVSFVLNKLWTFAAVRAPRPTPGGPGRGADSTTTLGRRD
ncbi:MAG: GtrA family protein [Intrasporangium sp.]|uniref:GtrA family protein n=1 Tax=Intrasporangium sp. TaxID=1925024 RepID=UPI002648FE09|nr:GtrA family protein [Intrasporangium sp.]MDN5794449.1 GtrA family protein [Intrasporangium sp.]